MEQHSLQHLLGKAQNSYNWLSHDPNGRGARIIAEFEKIINADLQHVPENYRAKYIMKFENHLCAWFASQSRCASTFITGGSNFPVRRQEKLHGWAENKYEELKEWRKRILAKLAASERKRLQGSELEEAKRNLAARKANQAKMIAFNKLVRKHKGSASCLPEAIELGFTESQVMELLNPPPQLSYHSKGYQTFELSLNNAAIKRLEDRVKMLEAKEAVKEQIQNGEKDTPVIEMNGAKIIQDYSDDRLKIEFPGKPAANVIASLKSSGFRWSPYLKVWCRKLTKSAVYDAERVCKLIAA